MKEYSIKGLCRHFGRYTEGGRVRVNVVKDQNGKDVRWTPVSDSLPPIEHDDYYGDGYSIPVIGCNINTGIVLNTGLKYCFNYSGGWIHANFNEGYDPHDYDLPEITHWMPFPGLPE